jgi:hypothetical protein
MISYKRKRGIFFWAWVHFVFFLPSNRDQFSPLFHLQHFECGLGVLGATMGVNCVPNSFWQAMAWLHSFIPCCLSLDDIQLDVLVPLFLVLCFGLYIFCFADAAAIQESGTEYLLAICLSQLTYKVIKYIQSIEAEKRPFFMLRWLH